LHVFLIIPTFTDSSGRVELPTNYNNSYTRLHRSSDYPSLNNVGPAAYVQINGYHSPHRHHGSGGSVSLPDIAEEQHPHRWSAGSIALSNVSEEMSPRITRLHHNLNVPEIVNPDSMVSPEITGSPDSVNSTYYIFSPDTVGRTVNPNLANSR
jgi:hypothetical protein